ncbi:MAG: DUF3786 domain-containing protein [Syntrophales bacterium]
MTTFDEAVKVDEVNNVALTILDLYKVLPKTNCGKCGLPTCLAFAAQVITQDEDVGKCPDLSTEARKLIPQIQEQQSTQGKRPDSLAIALKFLHEKVAPLDFLCLAPGLGAEGGEESGRSYLRLSYFGNTLQIFKDEIRYPAAINGNPWDAILLYNYIASQGNQALAGKWITFDSLPNSISKTKTLNKFEMKLASHFSSHTDLLLQKIENVGGSITNEEGDANVKAIFWALPRVPILMLFWNAIEEENFSAQCHFLFDAHVMSYLDLEALLFLVEQLQEHLILE